MLLSAITLGWAAQTQADDWTAPEVIEGNPVLAIAQSRWVARDGGIVLLGTGNN